MTLPASDQAAASDLLDCVQTLYRDLSVALRGKMAQLKAGTGGDADCRVSAGAIKRHRQLLQAVLDAEAHRGEPTNARAAGSSGELDLDAARAEVLARLALRVAEG